MREHQLPRAATQAPFGIDTIVTLISWTRHKVARICWLRLQHSSCKRPMATRMECVKENETCEQLVFEHIAAVQTTTAPNSNPFASGREVCGTNPGRQLERGIIKFRERRRPDP